MPIRDFHEGICFTKCLPCFQDFGADFLQKYTFARGFLLTPNEIQLDFFEHEKINDVFHLYHHFLLSKDVAKHEHSFVVILGYAYYIDDNKIFNDHLANFLLNCLDQSENIFLENLNYIAGRYVIIYSLDHLLKIVNDCSGLKSVFYSIKTGSCASHLELLNKVEDDNFSDIYQFLNEHHTNLSYDYPGNTTKYKNLFFLIPNFYFDIYKKTIHRFFPSKQRIYKSLYETQKTILDKFARQIEFISQNKKIAMTLTAGKDSKVSFIAAKKFWNEIIFYTESRDNDIEGANKIAQQYNLNWIGVDSKDIHLTNNSFYLQYNEMMKKNIFPFSSYNAFKIAFLLLNIFGINNFIHIHSNIAETGRGRSGLAYTYRNQFSKDQYIQEFIKLALMWKTKENKEYTLNLINNNNIIFDILNNHLDILNLSLCQKLGYNPWDFIYMETRCPNSLSPCHMNNDVTFDSISLCNTRDIILNMWQLDDMYINNSNILYKSIIYNFDHKILINENQNIQERDILYANYFIIEVLFKNKQYENCIQSCDILLKHNVLQNIIFYYMAYSYCELNNMQKTCEYLIKYIKYNDEDNNLNKIENIINAMRSKKEFDLANNILDQILLMNKNIAWVYKQKGHIYEYYKNYKLALLFYKESLNYDSKSVWTNASYCSTLLKLNQHTDCINFLSQLKQDDTQLYNQVILKIPLKEYHITLPA